MNLATAFQHKVTCAMSTNAISVATQSYRIYCLAALLTFNSQLDRRTSIEAGLYLTALSFLKHELPLL